MYAKSKYSAAKFRKDQAKDKFKDMRGDALPIGRALTPAEKEVRRQRTDNAYNKVRCCGLHPQGYKRLPSALRTIT